MGRSPGGGHGNLFQYSCLENPHGQRSPVGDGPWGHKGSDMTERLSTAQLSKPRPREGRGRSRCRPRSLVSSSCRSWRDQGSLARRTRFCRVPCLVSFGHAGEAGGGLRDERQPGRFWQGNCGMWACFYAPDLAEPGRRGWRGRPALGPRKPCKPGSGLNFIPGRHKALVKTSEQEGGFPPELGAS